MKLTILIQEEKNRKKIWVPEERLLLIPDMARAV
jgi:hypothetical protein